MSLEPLAAAFMVTECWCSKPSAPAANGFCAEHARVVPLEVAAPTPSPPPVRAKTPFDLVRETMPGRAQRFTFDKAGLAAVLEHVENRQAIARMRGLVDERPWPSTITLVAPTGSGKSVLACAFLGELLRRAETGDRRVVGLGMSRARFMFASALDRSQYEGMGNPQWAQTRALAVSASLLVLDEVRASSDFRVVRAVIDERFEAPRMTVITTPFLCFDDLMKATGDAGLGRRVFTEAVVINVTKPGQ